MRGQATGTAPLAPHPGRSSSGAAARQAPPRGGEVAPLRLVEGLWEGLRAVPRCLDDGAPESTVYIEEPPHAPRVLPEQFALVEDALEAGVVGGGDVGVVFAQMLGGVVGEADGA